MAIPRLNKAVPKSSNTYNGTEATHVEITQLGSPINNDGCNIKVLIHSSQS